MTHAQPTTNASRRAPTRGERAVCFIENYCIRGGKPVRLSDQEIFAVRCRLDHPDGPQDLQEPLDGDLAAFLVLLCLVGPEAEHGKQVRLTGVVADLWSVKRAAGPDLRPFLRQRGAAISNPTLGTRWDA